MAILRFFKMAAAAILHFRNFKFLTVGEVRKVELHHLAKFRQNRSNCGRNMAIFRILKMAAATILDFENFKFSTVGAVRKIEMLQRAKFRRNRLNRGRDMAIFLFFKMAAAAIFEKSKNHDILVAVGAISPKFGTVMHFDPLERCKF